MLTLRALSMEKVVTEDLSPHSYPQTLLDEIQNLKKFYNIGLNQQSCGKKRQLLDVRWSQDDIDAQIDYYSSYIDDEYNEYWQHLEEAEKWVMKLRTEISKKMNEYRNECQKLQKSILPEYHFMCFKHSKKDDNILIDEIKERLLTLVDEHYQRKSQDMKNKLKHRKGDEKERDKIINDTMKLFLQKRRFARLVINRMNFTI